MVDQLCENCGKANPDKELYCLTCGHILPAGKAVIATHSLPDEEPLKPQLRWGTAYFGDDSVLRLHLRQIDVVIEARFSTECVFGRSVDGYVPEVDLKPYDASRLGVSRQHCRLRREIATIMVEDMGSRNGTFLNGQRLLPYQARVLRNGDEIRLGHLVLRISYAAGPGTPNGKA